VTASGRRMQCMPSGGASRARASGPNAGTNIATSRRPAVKRCIVPKFRGIRANLSYAPFLSSTRGRYVLGVVRPPMRADSRR